MLESEGSVTGSISFLEHLWEELVWPYFAMFLISLATVLIAVPFCRSLALRLGIVDRPDHRKVHKEPIPYLGGLAMFAGYIVSLLMGMIFFPKAFSQIWRPEEAPLHLPPYLELMLGSPVLALAVGAFFVVLFGLMDDAVGLGARTKFGVQLLIGWFLFSFGFRVEVVTVPLVGPMTLPFWISFPMTLLWVSAVMNAINLIDGLDGLAAGVSFIGAGALLAVTFSTDSFSLVCVTSVVLMGCTLGFLKYNFHPASIFMGDTGSMLLGYFFAVMGIYNPQKGATLLGLFIPVVAVALAVIEATTTIFRRLRHKQKLGQADRGHIHHRLLHLGLTQRQVVVLTYFVSLFFGICAYLLKSVTDPAKRILVFALIALWTGVGIWVLGLLDQKRTRESQAGVPGPGTPEPDRAGTP